MKSFNEFAIDDVSLDGFQVVKKSFFARDIEPQMTFRKSSISFNVAAFKALNCVGAVQIMVNQQNRKILIRPISSDDPSSVNWLKHPDKPDSTPIECSSFTRPLYEMWKWKTEMRCRAYGRLVQNDKKVMLLFDFSAPVIMPHGRQNP